MRAVVDRTGLDRQAASTSQMGRFETVWLTSEANLAALADLSGMRWGNLRRGGSGDILARYADHEPGTLATGHVQPD